MRTPTFALVGGADHCPYFTRVRKWGEVCSMGITDSKLASGRAGKSQGIGSAPWLPHEAIDPAIEFRP
jgi:hypothetical protein